MNASPLGSHCPSSRSPGDCYLHQEGYCLPGLDLEDMPPPAPSAFWRERKDMVSMKKSKGMCCVFGSCGPC